MRLSCSYYYIFLFIVFSILNCSARFVKKEQLLKLETSYSGMYIIKKKIDIGNNQKSTIGDKVKLYFLSTSKAIKVYAYPFKENREQVIGDNILYLFDEEFPKKNWNQTILDKKLSEILQPSQ